MCIRDRVRPYLDEERTAGIVAAHYGEPVAMGRMQVELAEKNAVSAGFFFRYVFSAQHSADGYPPGLFRLDGLRPLQIP